MVRPILGNVKEDVDLTLFPSPFGEGCQAVFFQLTYALNISSSNVAILMLNWKNKKFGIAMQYRSFSTWRRRWRMRSKC